MTRKTLFLIVLVLAVVLNIFQFGFWDQKFKQQEKVVALNKQTEKKLKDSITQLQLNLEEANYFALETNAEALNYLENYNLEILLPYIEDQINSLNAQPKGNPLIPLDPIDGNKFVINKIKFLNNRWIIGNFSNGEMWGEIIIKYFINADETVSFETAEHIIFP